MAANIAEIVADMDVQAIAYDRWRIDLLMEELDRLGVDLPLVPWGQGFKDMAPAIDAIEAELLNARVAHGMHPALSMCAANAVVKKDPAGARNLDKARAAGRIDGMVAMVMAFGVAAQTEETGPSAYDDGQFMFV